ncbi:conserved Plasmodium protein, unknown function [Plasmodium gallinaceum]|uniref:Uncharacterized protein n=1 Tax=Plasmodium gallinaceum TaxID=5849 RepID=A0A1J1GTP4_PLAGA|nr:conserved Plasmodium protein, unknown function [Plasmodium gallinaceum]CRG94419.1 conserved Plasmodium protein, unknown function [Plasmodium gallinaceum]
MFSLKYFFYNLAWIALYHNNIKDNSSLIYPIKSYNSVNQRILRLDTPKPWGNSQTYEISRVNEDGNIVTTVYNREGQELYFYITKKRDNGNRGRNSRVRRGNRN